MSDALTPLRHAYGVEPAGPPPASAGAARVEHEMLRQMRAALDTRTVHRPDASVVGAVLARASEASSVGEAAVPAGPLAPLAAALGLPHEGAGEAPSGETALLAQTAEALDRLPRHRPDPQVLDRVTAYAAEASGEALRAVRSVYGEAEAVVPESPSFVEAEVLRQSREVVERTLASRPRPRPDEAAVGAVLARASEASSVGEAAVPAGPLAPLAAALGLPHEGAGEVPSGETALLAQTAEALDRLPRHRPATSTLEAILTQAALASAPARPAARRAADRPAGRPARRRAPVSVWAGGAALLLAALVAVVLFPSASDPGVTPEAVTVADAREPVAAAEGDGPQIAADVRDEAEAPAPPAPELSAPEPPVLTATAAASVASPARRASAALPPPSASAQPRRADASPTETPVAPAWDADRDLSTLALRVEKLDRETQRLLWDEPAEAFGEPASRTAFTATPGVQAVRAGAPARVVVRPDSTRQR